MPSSAFGLSTVVLVAILMAVMTIGASAVVAPSKIAGTCALPTRSAVQYRGMVPTDA